MSRRPLNGYERFFCDDPSRSVGEAKAIALSGILRSPLFGTTKGDSVLNNEAARAWRSTAAAHPYLRCVVEFVRHQEGAGDAVLQPELCELDMAAYEANILPHVLTVLPPPAQPPVIDDGDDAHAAFLSLARAIPFSESRSVATLVLQQRSGGSGGCLSFYVTLSHIGADARSIFAVVRTFLDAWDAECETSQGESTSGGAPVEEGRVVDLIGAIGIPRIVSSPLRLPILPDGMPPLVPPLERTPGRHADVATEWVSCATRHFVFPASDLALLLAHQKRLGISVQSVFSAAGALVTLRHQPIRDRLVASSSLSSASSATTEARAATDDAPPCLSLGVQATVQLRDKLSEPLPPSSILLGGSCIWSYVAIRRDSTLLSIARDVEVDLRAGLADGRVLGFFKMYLAPPPSSPAGGAPPSSSGVDTVRRQQQASYRPTFNFTNIGLTECSKLERLPRTGAQLSKLEFEFRLTSTHMQPAFGYLRATAHTFLGELYVAVTYTTPHFTAEFVDELGLEVIRHVQTLVRSCCRCDDITTRPPPTMMEGNTPPAADPADLKLPTVESLVLVVG